jgi:hypothetical protein
MLSGYTVAVGVARRTVRCASLLGVQFLFPHLRSAVWTRTAALELLQVASTSSQQQQKYEDVSVISEAM